MGKAVTAAGQGQKSPRAIPSAPDWLSQLLATTKVDGKRLALRNGRIDDQPKVVLTDDQRAEIQGRIVALNVAAGTKCPIDVVATCYHELWLVYAQFQPVRDPQ